MVSVEITAESPYWLARLPLPLINFYADKYKIDPIFLACLVMLESGGNSNVIRYEPQFRYTFSVNELAGVLLNCSQPTMEVMQKTSWGLMQVMGAVAYELGLGAEKELKDKWPTALLAPSVGMDYGCRHLKNKMNKYGDAPHTLYASYNGGSPQFTSGGMFINQRAVDRFMTLYRDLKGIT